VEWANRIPANTKIPGGRRKDLLKGIAERWVPREILERPKVGFTLPLGRWLRTGGVLASRLESLRESGAFVRSHLDPVILDDLLKEHADGAADHADLLWSLLALEVWAQQFLVPGARHAPLPGALTGRAAPSSAAAVPGVPTM